MMGTTYNTNPIRWTLLIILQISYEGALIIILTISDGHYSLYNKYLMMGTTYNINPIRWTLLIILQISYDGHYL